MFKSKKRYQVLTAILLVLTLVFAAVGCAPKTGAAGQPQASTSKYPEKPITVIIAFNAGTGTDANARLALSYIEKIYGTEGCCSEQTWSIGANRLG